MVSILSQDATPGKVLAQPRGWAPCVPTQTAARKARFPGAPRPRPSRPPRLPARDPPAEPGPGALGPYRNSRSSERKGLRRLEEPKVGSGSQCTESMPKCSAAKVSTSAGLCSSRKSRKSERTASASGCSCRYLAWLRRSCSWRGPSLSRTGPGPPRPRKLPCFLQEGIRDGGASQTPGVCPATS